MILRSLAARKAAEPCTAGARWLSSSLCLYRNQLACVIKSKPGTNDITKLMLEFVQVLVVVGSLGRRNSPGQTNRKWTSPQLLA